jgi:hypothetical protein
VNIDRDESEPLGWSGVSVRQTEGSFGMWFKSDRPVPTMHEPRPAARRGLVAGSALTLLLAGSLALAAPTFAQDTTDPNVTAEATVAADDSAGTTVEVGTTGEAAADPAATGTDAAADTAVAAEAPAAPAAAPAAGASGAAAPSALPNTGVGEAVSAPLALIGLAVAGAVAAGAVSVNRLRPAGRRA